MSTSEQAPHQGTKRYLPINVYEAAQQRLDLIFNNFDNIYVSFSGGKDSGLVLNLCLDYMRAHGITKKIGVWHQDFEAQYTETTNYVTRVLTDTHNLELIEPIWMCLPMRCKTPVSMYQQYWIPWNTSERDIWVRSMPEHHGVINVENHPFDFYEYAMLEDDLTAKFGPWYHRHVGKNRGRTIGLLGIRTQESLNRWRAITQEKGMYQSFKWTTKTAEADNVYTGYPIYDWAVEDVWTANAKFDYDYNHLYDLFYHAGLTVHQMRVASPFNDSAIPSLQLYRTIEPNVWGKLIGRVNGANFCAIYGATHAVAWKNIKLPPGHTWKTYVEFLLKTLPEDTRQTYEEKFATSIQFWREKGGVLSDQTIAELRSMGIQILLRGTTAYKTDKQAVTFDEYPDDLDVKEFQTVPSYKRMAICILKNDHLCKYMGFSQTKIEQDRRRAAIEKYRNI